MNLEELTKHFKQKYTDEYSSAHASRYAYSYLYLEKHLKPGMKVLEVGSAGSFGKFLAEEKGIDMHETTTNLCYPLLLASDQYDMVLNMEVIEHIKDQEDSGPVHCWNGSGIACLLSECYRVLKPGGKMYATTPNAHTVLNIDRILNMHAGMFYRPHVREYSVKETEKLIKTAGFKILDLYTDNVWKHMLPDKYDWLKSIVVDIGCDISLMKEDIIVLASK